jgi:hypothetical protein
MMSDDIVDRLRNEVCCGWHGCTDCVLMREGADEIERLRKQLSESSRPPIFATKGCLLSWLFLGLCWGLGVGAGVIAYRIVT